MMLITDAQRDQLIENGRKASMDGDLDPDPVVKLFTPDGAATWLLTEIDPQDPDLAFGLCDLGFGEPELGSVRLSELRQARGGLGLPIERDLYFTPKGPLSAYVREAYAAGEIRA